MVIVFYAPSKYNKLKLQNEYVTHTLKGDSILNTVSISFEDLDPEIQSFKHIESGLIYSILTVCGCMG